MLPLLALSKHEGSLKGENTSRTCRLVLENSTEKFIIHSVLLAEMSTPHTFIFGTLKVYLAEQIQA